MVKNRVSIVIPARNEIYLYKTTLDLLQKAQEDIEIIIVLDGYWPDKSEMVNDPRVSYIHYSQPRGMRNAINSAIRASQGEYIMKIDAHCMVSKGYDKELKSAHKDNWIQIPRRYALDPVKWALEDRNDTKYPIDVMVPSDTLQGIPGIDPTPDQVISDTPISQGSCWFTKRDYYDKSIALDEEKWGMFYWEFLEIMLKCWPTGGEIKVNKAVWYAHWHKTGHTFSLGRGEREKAQEVMETMKPEIDFIKNKFNIK